MVALSVVRLFVFIWPCNTFKNDTSCANRIEYENK